MALDADGDGDAVPGVDHPGVLPRADEHPWSLGRQPLEVHARRLVRAVLAPHDGVERQLQVVGRPPENLLHGLELVVGQAEGPVQRRRLLGGGSHGAYNLVGRTGPAGR